MGFVSFIGRVLFSAIFILAAWQKIQDFGVDGGGALKSMEPKIELFRQHVQETLHFSLPVVEMKYLLMVAIGLEGLGGLLFTFGSSLGAYLLVCSSPLPLLHFEAIGLSFVQGPSTNRYSRTCCWQFFEA
jgi:uncharacterized membrane protein YphA (DoxX/SURF4 family)